MAYEMNFFKIKIILFLSLIALFLNNNYSPAEASSVSEDGKKVIVGVRLISVLNIDLVANSYILDFYIWFDWNPSDFNYTQISDFEFLDGAPDKKEVFYSVDGFLEYRVRGEFVKTLDFRRYPFENHALSVVIEHSNLNVTCLIYEPDVDSGLDPGFNIIGWGVKDFKTDISEHYIFGNNCMSNFSLNLTVERPFFSSFVKNVLPLIIIVLISMLTFLIDPSNYDSRLGLAISSLISASAIHLSLLTGYPSSGYMTISDWLMLMVYMDFLYILATSVWIMKLVVQRRNDDAVKFNSKSWRILLLISSFMILTLFIIYFLSP